MNDHDADVSAVDSIRQTDFRPSRWACSAGSPPPTTLQLIDSTRLMGENGGIRGRHRPSSSSGREEVSSMERYEDLEGTAVGLINAVIN
ncbi:hypothetical protein [Micromonospora wenchangensis]|uniref:hypothetical protein n=1 Tax=Micromonospora wenchangensis TaxID=1185415 RepID=UPI0013040822|nr:hypothetical protein [Micromonospora wenchangensis]